MIKRLQGYNSLIWTYRRELDLGIDEMRFFEEGSNIMDEKLLQNKMVYFIQNLLVQLFSTLDTIIGPSFWIKIYLSIDSICSRGSPASNKSVRALINCSLASIGLLEDKKYPYSYIK